MFDASVSVAQRWNAVVGGKLLTQQQRTSPHIKHQQKRVDSQERTK